MIHGKWLGKAAVNADAVRAFDPAVGGVAAREKEDARAVGKPGDNFVVDTHALTKRLRASLIKGKLLGLSALGGHHVDVEIAVILSREGDPLAVG